MATKTTAAIYTRISDDREGKGAGVARQEAEARQLADRLGWEVVRVFSDNSISSYAGAPRPQYRALLDALRNGEVDAVIAYAADRLTRQPRELEDLVDVLEETGTMVQTVTGGMIDLTTPDGRTSARVVGAVARGEVEKMAKRVRSAKSAATARGEMSGGRRAFGWTESRRAIEPEEMEILRDLGRRALSGEGISTMVTDLNRRGIKTSQGKAWSRASLRNMLINPATAGLRRQPDGSVIEGTWEGAWDRDTWNHICALLQDPARRTTHRLRHYLLTGLVTDSEGRKLVTGHDVRGRTYRTDSMAHPGPGQVSISADLVEKEMVRALFKITDKLELSEPSIEVADPVIEIQAELDALAEMFGRGDLSAGEWNAARGPLTERMKAARKTAAKAGARVSDMPWSEPGQLRKVWDALTIQQQRSAIELFIEAVVILPAKKGAQKQDTKRVKVVSRQP